MVKCRQQFLRVGLLKIMDFVVHTSSRKPLIDDPAIWSFVRSSSNVKYDFLQSYPDIPIRQLFFLELILVFFPHILTLAIRKQSNHWKCNVLGRNMKYAPSKSFFHLGLKKKLWCYDVIPSIYLRYLLIYNAPVLCGSQEKPTGDVMS